MVIMKLKYLRVIHDHLMYKNSRMLFLSLNCNKGRICCVIPPPLVLKYHINTFGVTSFLRNIFHMFQEQLKGNQTL